MTLESVLDSATCLYDKADIDKALDNVADEISQQLADKKPLVLCVMSGGLMFCADLLRRFDFPLELDYLHATRYRGATSGGAVHWLAEPKTEIKGRDILIVDDILDGGVTLQEIISYCEGHNAKSVLSAVFIDKQTKRHKKGLKSADFVGLEAGDYYLVGYGMDYKGFYRNAMGIYALEDV